jgi:phosphoribosylamine---glycine ligase
LEELFPLKILIIGSGGREHAIAWRCAQEGHQVFATPGNPGIATFAECIPPGGATAGDYLAVAKRIGADLTIVGPEAPLVAGVVDLFIVNQMKIFGPTQIAAELEGSKAFAKEFFDRHQIPTARYQVCEDLASAQAALSRFDYPVVLKADGLAAGKGVVIAKDKAMALATLEDLFSGKLVGAAGARVVIEDFHRGEEVSFIALCDGLTALPLRPTQDHKAIFDNDEGPNTGGMGAYCDDRILSADQTQFVMERVILPTLEGMSAEGRPFRGFLFAGLMMTAEGPLTLEFNVRLGDPETQALMYRIESGFAEACLAATEGRLAGAGLTWLPGASACVVMAAHNYPASPRSGDAIQGIHQAHQAGAMVFHAGTKVEQGQLQTAGGRVLGVTGRGAKLQEALEIAYAGVGQIHFAGQQHRSDIGQKGLRRYTIDNHS